MSKWAEEECARQEAFQLVKDYPSSSPAIVTMITCEVCMKSNLAKMLACLINGI